MVGIINIEGLLTGASLMKVLRQVKQQPKATSFRVNLNSKGGDAEAAFTCMRYLNSLNKPLDVRIL